MKTDYSSIWKQADKQERSPTVGLDKRIYDKFRNFSTLMIVRKMEQAGPDRNLDDETHELTARLLFIGYDWKWNGFECQAIEPVPALEQKASPKSLPWPEKVAMLSINPDAASIADVAQLASQLINCHQQDAIKTREINALIAENRALIMKTVTSPEITGPIQVINNRAHLTPAQLEELIAKRLPRLSKCPACGYYAFNGQGCFDCGYKP